MKGRPFVMLGVNTDADAETAGKVIEAQGVTWPNWYDAPGDAPIVRRYRVRGYPTVYVIDGKGTIRSKMAVGDSLAALIDTLAAEREAAGDRVRGHRIPDHLAAACHSGEGACRFASLGSPRSRAARSPASRKKAESVEPSTRTIS